MKIKHYSDLIAYQKGYTLALNIYDITKKNSHLKKSSGWHHNYGGHQFQYRLILPKDFPGGIKNIFIFYVLHQARHLKLRHRFGFVGT